MNEPITVPQLREWIDEELVEDIEQIPDDTAEFNVTVEMSNMLIHIVRREPGGPLIIGQQIEYGEEIRSRIREMAESSRNELVTRIREALTAAPVVYGFHDEHGTNTRFKDVYRIFLEHRIYPGAITQQRLMDGLINVWKTMRFLDDIVALIDSVTR